MEPIEQANELLGWIRNLKKDIATREAEAQAELDAVKEKYVDIFLMTDDLAEFERDLSALLKKHKKEIFGDKPAKVQVGNGSLIWDEQDKVVIPNGSAETIFNLGYTDGVKVTKTVIRHVVETWPDEKLNEFGAHRKPKHRYAYEIKGYAA